MGNIGISVVIPVYGGEKHLQDCIEETKKYLIKKNFDYEIIIVYDGGFDKTENSANNFKDSRTKILFNIVNLGKGAAVRKGILSSRKNLVLFMDVDMSTPIENLERLIRPIIVGGCDIAIGSRVLEDSNILKKQPFLRDFLSKNIKKFINNIVKHGYKDTQCGFKIFKREVAHDIFSRVITYGFAFDIEVLLLARRLGYRVKEVPVSWQDRSPSTFNFIKFLKSIVEFRKIINVYKPAG